ncbi:MAG: precorrin-2 C(20)-methyltransferase [Rhodospirillales bacterium]|nr:precorrin-2 C(20)-methyltransferase [Rhodospirillales bacterium]
MNGTLFGLGVGPGDPELLTLKAVRIIGQSPVIAYPAPDVGDSLARAIAAPHIPDGRHEIVIRTPMVAGNFPADDVYDHYAEEIASHLKEGRDVAVLCEGDPFLFGSFMYIYTRLAAAFPVQVIPGVSSLGACAAAAGVPLVSRNQMLSIIPAPLPEADLKTRIKAADAVCIMKVGRHLEKVCRVVADLGLTGNAHYVEHASMANQKVCALTDLREATAPYFSMILIRKPEPESKQ